MAASDHLSHMQSGKFVGDPRDIPAEFGTQPIPEGMVRINHYTTVGAVEDIKQQGLLRSKGEEAFARGGTESPQVFATAGHPGSLLHTGAPIVEAYADPSRGGQLDVGEHYGQGGSLQEHIKHMEANRSTVTFRGDLPPNQILGVHEPWHARARYIAHEGLGRESNPADPYATGSLRAQVARGEHDDLHEVDPDYGPAVKAVKVMNAATVMLGGKL